MPQEGAPHAAPPPGPIASDKTGRGPARVHAGLPTIAGKADAAYLSGAIARAGRNIRAADAVVTSSQARTAGCTLETLQSNIGRFFLKRIPDGVPGVPIVEIRLWEAGITRALPRPTHSPNLDLAFNADRGEWWLLMSDISVHMRTSRIDLDCDALRTLIDGVARLQARFWNAPELGWPADHSWLEYIDSLARPMLAFAGREEMNPWLRMRMDRARLEERLPFVFDAWGADTSEFFLALCAEPARWTRPLHDLPRSIVHNDLHEGNVGIGADGQVWLLDWNGALSGPAMLDLAKFFFFRFWCFPKIEHAGSFAAACRDYYFDRITSAAGDRIDPGELQKLWDLSWLWTFVLFAWRLGEDVAEMPDKDAIASRAANCRRIADHARRIAGTYLE